jgi:hypothetical protein
MKKINSRLQLTKTTVRTLQGAELTAIHGGIGRGVTNDPQACAAVAAHRPGGIDKP